MTQDIQHIYIAIQDAMLELDGVKGTRQAMECLDIANAYCKDLMHKLEANGLAERQPDHFYNFLGIENPRESEA